jgi:uncharacterized protein YeaO (DUF488 family)
MLRKRGRVRIDVSGATPTVSTRSKFTRTTLKQTAELNRLGPSQQLTDSHRQEWEGQTKDFAKERERYIVEFYDAQRTVEEMREREKQESFERGDERDKDLGFSR